VKLTSKRGRKEKFKRRTSIGAYRGSFVKLVHDKPIVDARNHQCLINSLNGD
jgi:hypothetical protein